jgi:hypothetical protein
VTSAAESFLPTGRRANFVPRAQTALQDLLLRAGKKLFGNFTEAVGQTQ